MSKFVHIFLQATIYRKNIDYLNYGIMEMKNDNCYKFTNGTYREGFFDRELWIQFSAQLVLKKCF